MFANGLPVVVDVRGSTVAQMQHCVGIRTHPQLPGQHGLQSMIVPIALKPEACSWSCCGHHGHALLLLWSEKYSLQPNRIRSGRVHAQGVTLLVKTVCLVVIAQNGCVAPLNGGAK